MAEIVLVPLALSSAWMSAVGWYVQLVHYPTFRLVPAEKFAEFHAFHSNLTGLLVGPPIIVQVLATFGLTLARDRVPLWMVVASFVLLAASVGWTAVVSGPMHLRISAEGPLPQLIDRLIAGCWVRNIAWTAQTILAAWALLAARSAT